MRVVYLTSRYPYPLEKGDKLRAYYQLKELAKTHEVHLISIVDDDISKKDLEVLRKIVQSVYIIRISPVERIWSLFVAIAKGIPFQTAWFYSKKIEAIITTKVAEIQPDQCFCQLARMAEYCRRLPYPKTLDYMDSFGVGMARRAQVAKGIAKYLYTLEAKRMIQYEADIANDFDQLTIISQQDKEQFTFPKASKIHILPNGIDPSFFAFPNKKPTFDLVFVGNMGYLPNIEAAEYLANEILPKCPPSTTLLLAGAQPHARVRKLASNQITISGWIEDIRDAYASAQIFVAPLWSGTGQQNKILEAMAMGIPCITTTAVNNAIGATPKKDVMIADDAHAFIKTIEILTTNADLRKQISSDATIFVQQKYDWKQSGTLLSAIFAAN